MAPQVDDVVDVLDRDRAGLNAGPARDAVPDALLGNRGRYERALLAREHLVAKTHDHELRREHLAGRKCRTDVLTAPALGAGVGVEHLLPGQVRSGAGAEADLVLRHI